MTNYYIYKAMDAYPYELETTMEALDMALAYDENNVVALILKGRVHAEMLKEYSTAIDYYEAALAEEINNLEIHEHYIKVLLWNDETERAKNFIDYAMEIQGADKGNLYINKALALEMEQDYEQAIAILKYAPLYGYNMEFIDYCIEIEKRIQKKKELKSRIKPMQENEEVIKEPVRRKLFGILF